MVEVLAIFKLYFRGDGVESVACAVDDLHDVVDSDELLVFFGLFGDSECFGVSFGEGAAGGAGGAVAFLSVNFHVAVDHDFEEKFLSAVEVVADGGGLSDHDVLSGPFVYVF